MAKLKLTKVFTGEDKVSTEIKFRQNMLKSHIGKFLNSSDTIAVVDIPVELLAVDDRYQRVGRPINDLVKNWDERKIGVLQGVPHLEEGKVYLTDGYGRWKASQKVDPDKYSVLKVAVILKAPQDPTERLKFEAELFATQDLSIKKVKPEEKHNALCILGDEGAIGMKQLQREFGFRVIWNQGNRSATYLGSYASCQKMCKTYGIEPLRWVFNILRETGYSTEKGGYKRDFIKAILDVYLGYLDYRTEISNFLIRLFSEYETPEKFFAEAKSKYPSVTEGKAIKDYLFASADRQVAILNSILNRKAI